MIPKPYYQDAHVTLYCGDCREILPKLGKFDLLLTDPPYGHGDKWQGGTWGAAEMYKDAMKWDAETPSEDTIADVLKAATVGIVWGGNYFRLPPSRCWLSWEKSSRMDTLADFELAWTSMDRPCKAKREDRNPDGKRVHPTQKPLSILQWCFGFVPDAKTVLDPFAGSCTTGVAAKLEGRHATLIEISERYCEIGAERLRQGVLF
jgi:DNA modification methylase